MADLSLHFHKPAEWGPHAFIHYWNSRPSGAGTTWPGTRMNAGAGDWYSVVLPGVAAIDLVFNDGSGHQTADLHRNGDGWYDAKGRRWLNAAPAASADNPCPLPPRLRPRCPLRRALPTQR